MLEALPCPGTHGHQDGWTGLRESIADAGAEGVFGVGQPRAEMVHCRVHRLGVFALEHVPLPPVNP